MIEVHDLTVRYGGFSLTGVSVSVGAGRRLGVLGASGAGKSMLLETIIGLRRPERGRIVLDGREIGELPPEERRIAYIPQDLALFPHLSVRENIAFGLAPRSARRRCEGPLAEVASLLGIEGLLARGDVSSLSGGEKQRVALARALIRRPRVIFLDEPFTGLDAATRTDLLRSFRALAEQLAMTVFFVTHDLDEAFYLADDVAIMMNGRIVRHGAAAEVFANPGRVDVARFLNVRNIIPAGRLPAGLVERLTAGAVGPVSFAIRPECIGVSASGRDRADGADSLRARVEQVIAGGSWTTLVLRLDDATTLEATLSPEHAAALRPRVGQEVAVHLPPEAWMRLAEGE